MEITTRRTEQRTPEQAIERVSAHAGDAPALKRYRAGTHRLCEPAETYARIRPLLPALGITRVADVTRLDRIGIPTYQAISPNSRALVVAMGKGLTAIAAKVSAVMEGAETWHAEQLAPPSRVARVAEVEADLGYDVMDVCHLERSLLNGGMRLDWLAAQRMDGSGETLVPRALVSLDWRVEQRWTPPVFFATSNGLASGNSVDEAALHGLCELVERDGTARARSLPPHARHAVDIETIDAPEATDLLARIAAAGAQVEVFDERGPTALPSFRAVLWSADYPVGFPGYGCHLDPAVALCRALTEAAQTRLAQIAGSREDVGRTFQPGKGTGVRFGGGADSAAPMSFRDIKSLATDDITRDLSLVVDRVMAQAGVSPIVVDLSRRDFGIPVVKVLAPGLLHDSESVGRRA